MAQPRHRARTPARRRTRSALVAAAAVLAVAAPVSSTVDSATAATTHTWERLAGCESGGRWHINTGNGYYGGLQFSYGTWQNFGGGKYARTADRASKAEQILIAEKVLKAQGWGAWPYCSNKLGLTSADAKATDDVIRARFVHPWNYDANQRSGHTTPLGRIRLP